MQNVDFRKILDFSTFSRLQNSLASLTFLLYTSDAADDLLCLDLGGRRNIKKKKKINNWNI